MQQKVHVAAREQQLEVTKKAKNDIAVLLTALGVDFSCQSHFRFDKQTQQSGRFIKFFATEQRAHFRATTSFACARSYYILYANSNGACVVEHLAPNSIRLEHLYRRRSNSGAVGSAERSWLQPAGNMCHARCIITTSAHRL